MGFFSNLIQTARNRFSAIAQRVRAFAPKPLASLKRGYYWLKDIFTREATAAAVPPAASKEISTLVTSSFDAVIKARELLDELPAEPANKALNTEALNKFCDTRQNFTRQLATLHTNITFLELYVARANNVDAPEEKKQLISLLLQLIASRPNSVLLKNINFSSKKEDNMAARKVILKYLGTDRPSEPIHVMGCLRQTCSLFNIRDEKRPTSAADNEITSETKTHSPN